MGEIKRETKIDLNNRMQDLGEILNNSWDGIAVIDENGNFVYINDAFSPMFGYPKKDILKNNINAFIYDEYKSYFKISLKKALRLGHLRHIKVACKRSDKQKIYLNISLSLMLNKKYFVLNAQDITKHLERDLVLNKYVISSNISKDGTILHASYAFCIFIGYSAEELEHKKIFDIINQDDANALKKSIIEEKEFNQKIEFITKKQHRCSLYITTKFSKNKYGDIVDIELFCLNLTTIANCDNAPVLQQKDKSISKIDIMSDTLNIIADQWQENITAINLELNRLLEYLEGTKISKKAIVQKCQFLKDNISSVYEQIKTFKLPEFKEESKELVDIAVVVKNAINMFEVANSEHTISIEKDIEQVPHIKTYPNELMEILINIMKNSLEAFRFAGRRGGLLDISLHQTEDDIVIQIIDNAGEVPYEVTQRVFEPFFSTKKAKDNPGLGLYHAKLIVESALKGKIEFINEDYTTSVIITLPKKIETKE